MTIVLNEYCIVTKNKGAKRMHRKLKESALSQTKCITEKEKLYVSSHIHLTV